MVSAYQLYLYVSALSGFSSLCMLCFIIYFSKNLKSNLLLQALILYCAFDIMGTISWCLDDKYGESTSYEMCCIQEYLFQASNVYKAVITVLISNMALSVAKELKPPKFDAQFIKMTVAAFILTSIVLALSIWLGSANLFCGTSDNFVNDISYFVVFLTFIYICVAVNIILYRFIRIRAKLIAQYLRETNNSSANDGGAEVQILSIVRKLRMYPDVFCLCWLPEVVLVVLYLATGRQMPVINYTAGIMINSSGTMVAACYFYQQYNRRFSASSTPDEVDINFIRASSRSKASLHTQSQNPLQNPTSNTSAQM